MKKLVLLSIFYLLSSCHDDTNTSSTDIEENTPKSGLDLFSERCTSCHGANGKLGFSGAKDLTLSTITKEQAIAQITNGKKAMPPFKNLLTFDEIDSVATYCIQFQLPIK